ncbi:right-handed parallel beta-helix repeat-containing protein [Halorubrum sp. Atlit-28R]|uniref:right-handed parallel beta-helix repeat-containing protein n=1 Tax=Halorubrum sp. Atlit-28R TaxID=2282129 RepID=UPI000EF1D49B|nr:right-handed parallel beta-helix repeat-containing protein [Halorubrum sp. Atlit-28R]RLM49534.1 hypothetical protein DVK06_14300 [Halorubrum sp. Atlit-28R]
MIRDKRYTTLLIVVVVLSSGLFAGTVASSVPNELQTHDVGASDVVVEPGDSIQDAIATANSGDTVTIQEGTYEESIEINKPLTLVGNGDVVLDGNNIDTGYNEINGITVTASDVTIEGIEVRRYPDNGISVLEGDLLTRSVTLDNVVSRLNGHDGLYIEATTDQAELTVTSSRFIDNGDLGIHGSGEFDSTNFTDIDVTENADSGIFIETLQANVLNSSITNNGDRSGEHGLSIQNAETVSVSNTTIFESYEDNINIVGTAPLTRTVTVENVSSRNAGADGLLVEGTSDQSTLSIDNSQFSGNGDTGIDTLGQLDNFAISNSQINENNDYGLSPAATTVDIDSIRVSENGASSISSSDDAGILLDNPETAVITNSTILSSYDDNIRVIGSDPLTRSVEITNVSSRLAGSSGLSVAPTDEQSELQISDSEFSGNNNAGVTTTGEFDIANLSSTTVTSNDGDGVYLESQSVDIADLDVTSNGDDGFSDDNGILIDNGQTTTIENTTVTGSSETNIYIDGEPITRSVVITNVVASQSQNGDGIAAVATPEQDTITLTNISAVGNNDDGLDIGTAVLNLDQSTVNGNGDVGIIATPDRANITRSSVQNNGDNGIQFLSLGTEATVSLNSILGNGEAAVVNDQEGVTVDAQNNWWGTASGPSEADIVGDVNTNDALASPPGLNGVINPAAVTVEPTEQTSVGIQLEGARNGVTAYQFDLSVANSSVANISAINATNEAEFVDINVSDDGSAASVNVGMGDSPHEVNNPTVVKVTLTTAELGETTLSLSDVTATDLDNEEYLQGETTGATITVSESVSPSPVVGEDEPNDLNGDGLYEDIDGDGEFDVFDVQALFNNRDSTAVTSNPEAFNFAGDENPDSVSVFDVQALFTDLQQQ